MSYLRIEPSGPWKVRLNLPLDSGSQEILLRQPPSHFVWVTAVPVLHILLSRIRAGKYPMLT
jgi:hypothetical protein